MSFFQTRGRAILTSAFLLIGAIGVGLGARTAYDAMMGGDCCAPGSPCCFPGSPCCNHAHGGVASAR